VVIKSPEFSRRGQDAGHPGEWMVVYTTMAVLVETITESRAKIRRRR
jgi:hypothetical protein